MKKWTKNLHLRIIILEGLIDYFERTKSNEIRRGALKSYCEDNLDILGGAFERALGFLENEGILERQKNKQARITQIVFNISKVRNLKNSLSVPEAFSTPSETITQEDIESEFTREDLESVWQEAVINATSSILANFEQPSSGTRYIQELIKRLIVLMMGLFASRSFSFNIRHTRGNSSYLRSKSTILELAKTAYLVSSKNPQNSFEITIQYNGIVNPSSAMEAFTPEIIKLANPFLLEFCKEVFRYDFSDMDKYYLANGEIDKLSAKGFNYARDFWEYFVFPLIPIYGRVVAG